MTKELLLAKLKMLAEESKSDEEAAHANADRLLLDFIGDADVTQAFDEIRKWYA